MKVYRDLQKDRTSIDVLINNELASELASELAKRYNREHGSYIILELEIQPNSLIKEAIQVTATCQIINKGEK